MACIERNGVIDNYIVRFGPEGGVQSERTVQSGGIGVPGTHTASGLNPFTNYSFEVAAVNSAGTGPFTATLTVETIGGGELLQYMSITHYNIAACVFRRPVLSQY